MTTENPTEEQLLLCEVDTVRHIRKVQRLLRLVAVELLYRGEVHDASKIEPEEIDIFAVYGPRLKGLTYGSDEYKASLAEMGKALAHHYANNRHHPEFFPVAGVGGMNLVDLVEMFCDWFAATQRHADGDIFKSIDLNKDRFQLSDQLVRILRNTASFLKMQSAENV